MVRELGRRRATSRLLSLVELRESRGIALSQVVESTKIGSHFLQAIEEEEFDKLPGGIFDTSYIRQYARAIGYEEEALLACYRRKMEPSCVEPEHKEKVGWWRTMLRWLGVPSQVRGVSRV